MVVTFEEVAKLNVKPNLEYVDLGDVKFKTVSDVRSMTKEAGVAGDFIITCDNPLWLMKSTNDRGEETFYSYDGVAFYLTPAKRLSMLAYDLTGNKLSLSQTLPLDYATSEEILDLEPTKKEEIRMANEMNDLDALMAAADKDISGSAGDSGMQKMENFGGKDIPAKPASDEEAKFQRKAEKMRMDALMKQIKDDVKGSAQPIDMSLVQKSWAEIARLICFVTPTDKRQSLAAVKVSVPVDSRKLADNVPEDIKGLYFRNRASVPAEYLKTEYEIKAREGKPGAPRGVIARIPAFLQNCTVMDYTKSVALKGAETNGDASVIEMFEITDFEQKLTLVGASIMEAEETAPPNGKAGEIRINYDIPSSNAANNGNGVLENQGIIFSKKLVRVGHGNKTTLHDNNYFPLVTYHTVNINDKMDKDVLEALNLYTFDSLFNPGKNSKQIGTKYESLIESSKSHIVKDGDSISSDFITNDGGKRINMTMTAFYDKTVIRPTIELPLKQRTEKADKTLGAPAFKKYNVTLEDKMADESYRKMTSLGNGKFDNIISIVGEDILNPANLREKFKRQGGGGASSRCLTVDIARELLLTKMQGGLDNYTLSGYNFN